MHGIDTIKLGDRQDERDNDDNGREDVHHAAHDQQEHVQQHQKLQRRIDMHLHPPEELHGYLGIDQQVGEPHGDAEDDEDAAHQYGGIFEQRKEVFPQVYLPMDETLEYEDIDGGAGGGLADREVAAEDANDNA